MSARCPEIVLMGFRGGFVFDIQGCERYYRSGVCANTQICDPLQQDFRGDFVFDFQGCEGYYRSGACANTNL